MTKRRKKKKPAAIKKPAPVPVVRKVALPTAGIVQVDVPKGILPVIIHDPQRSVVEIAQVPVKNKKSWWQW